MRIWELLLAVVILAGIALIPAIFNLSIVQYADFGDDHPGISAITTHLS